ncbi:galactose-3-O-sulfotransferase 3-like isoform X2 [Branchiostoma floridae x Branchiostoma belcheri]
MSPYTSHSGMARPATVGERSQHLRKNIKEQPSLVTFLWTRQNLWRFFLSVTSALVVALFLLLHFEENLVTPRETRPRLKGWLSAQPTNSSTHVAELTPPPCQQPQTNVAFMKVHKCGSTTVQKVFLRYGHKHRLTVALPRERDRPSIGTAGVITQRDYLALPRGYPNIFAHHAIYNRTGFQKLMPKNTKYVAILREPLSRLRSSFKYFKMERYFIGLREAAGSKPPVLTYLEDPKRWDKLYRPSTRKDFVDHICNRNCMARDLGLKETDYENKTAIENFIRNIERDFSLVMILEQFDQSMVLLRRRMCWSVEDIMYDSVQPSKRSNYGKTQYNITDRMRQNFIEHNYADYLLYNHFKEAIARQITKEGAGFQKELQNYQKTNKVVSKICHSRVKNPNYVVRSSKGPIFRVDKLFCDQMKTERQRWDPVLRRDYTRSIFNRFSG